MVVIHHARRYQPWQPLSEWPLRSVQEVEAQLRADLKLQQEQRLKAREAKAARLARAQRKQPALSESQVQKQAEKLFVRALIDACPRCGFEPPPGADRESLQAHLVGCVDQAKDNSQPIWSHTGRFIWSHVPSFPHITRFFFSILASRTSRAPCSK